MDNDIINRGFDFQACFATGVYKQKIVFRWENEVFKNGFANRKLLFVHGVVFIADAPDGNGMEAQIPRKFFQLFHLGNAGHITNTCFGRSREEADIQDLCSCNVPCFVSAYNTIVYWNIVKSRMEMFPNKIGRSGTGQ